MFSGFVRCGVPACRAAAGACRCPAAGASPSHGRSPAGPMSTGSAAGFAQQHPAHPGLWGGCTDQVAKGEAARFSVTPLSTG